MLKIVIKPTSASSGGGDRFLVSVSEDMTVAQLKNLIAQRCDLAEEQQRLIYKGKILKDAVSISEYGASPKVVLCHGSPGPCMATSLASVARLSVVHDISQADTHVTQVYRVITSFI
jgi:Ubiquitin family